MYIVNVGYVDAPKVSDRCFETFRCRDLSDVFSLIDNYICRKKYISVRFADPSEENISLWPFFNGNAIS